MKQVRTRNLKKSTVSLTSLLDLLFVMVFVSLLQTKKSVIESTSIPTPTKKIISEKKIEAPKIIPIRAVFEFFATPSNPSTPSGSFIMNGEFNSQTGAFSLGGSSWIKRPESYEMIPLSGSYDSKLSLLRGKIESTGCKEFTLQKNTASKGISGVWEGTYFCLQGETGIRLKISQ